MTPRGFVRPALRLLMRLIMSHGSLERAALRVLGRFPQLRYRVRRVLLDRPTTSASFQSPEQLASADAAAAYFDLRDEIARRRRGQ